MATSTNCGSLTKDEIFSQYAALRRTVPYVRDRADDLQRFFRRSHHQGITYVGSGSSFCLCQSAELHAKLRLKTPASVLAAGDLMINFSHYRDMIRDTLLIAPSRSGSTTEVVHAYHMARKELNVPCMSICASEDSDLAAECDLTLEIPWAFDRSVCQTRTVTNLYAANLVKVALLGGDELLLREIDDVVEAGDAFMEQYAPLLKGIAENMTWTRAVVLGDSEIQGIAAEGAVALMEIPQVHANYYHTLDVRHGPMVLLDRKTLVIMAVSPHGIGFQRDLVRDLRKKGCLVITVGIRTNGGWASDLHVETRPVQNYAVVGIPFIFVPQAIGYYRAVACGINPDEPDGLDPWIELVTVHDDEAERPHAGGRVVES